MKILTSEQYYQAYGFYIAAKKLFNESDVFSKLLIRIVGDGSQLIDSVFDPSVSGTKDEFNQYLQKEGFDVDWKGNLTNGKQENTKQ